MKQSAYPAKNKEVARIEYFKDFFNEMTKLSKKDEALERGEEVAPEPKRKLGYLSGKRKRIVDAAIEPVKKSIEDRLLERKATEDKVNKKT